MDRFGGDQGDWCGHAHLILFPLQIYGAPRDLAGLFQLGVGQLQLAFDPGVLRLHGQLFHLELPVLPHRLYVSGRE